MVSSILKFVILIHSTFHSTFAQNLPDTTVAPKTKRTIKIGIAAAQRTQTSSIGWSVCGGAVPMAIERLREFGYVKDFDFEFIVDYTECDQGSVVRAGIEFIKTHKVDVIIGPPCAQALRVMSFLAENYKKPVLGWGFVSDTDLSDVIRFPYLTTVIPNSLMLGYAASKMLTVYNWGRVAMLYYYSDIKYCSGVMNDVEATFNNPSTPNVNIVIKAEIYLNDNETTDIVFQSVKSRARIIFWCTQTAIEKRDYLIKIATHDMIGDEYVHIMLSMRNIAFGAQTSLGKPTFSQSGLTPIWESFTEGTDDFEKMVKQAATRMFVLDVNSEVADKKYLDYLQKNIMKAVQSPPMNCSTVECMTANTTIMGGYARQLFDVVYLYGVALTNTNSTDPAVYDDVDVIVPQFVTSFQGMTGKVVISPNLTRMPIFQLYGLNSDYEQVALAEFTYIDPIMNVTLSYKEEGGAVWYFYGNSRPLDIPICGFLGKFCPISFWEQYMILAIVSISVIVLMVIIMIIGCLCVISAKHAEQARTNAEWQVPFVNLMESEKQIRSNATSRRSLQSAPSISTGHSGVTTVSDFCENYTMMMYEKEMVLTAKYQYTHLTKADKERFVKMRKLDHENINRFIGLSIDSAHFIAVTKLCSRGSLQDILSRGNFSMDYFFMFCIIRDVAKGLEYLHKTFLRLHGNLRSATCLVNDSWQVKLAEYGMDNLVEEQTPPKKRLLWVAPEVLRGSLSVSQMEPSADIYSFAIIASEILTKKEAWDILDRKEDCEALIALVKDCWAEVPEDRPTAENICSQMKGLVSKQKTNLMDHVFNMLEEYTSTLEEEIEERTKELTLEKKKADILLSRMLPKQVAERLKAGQTVEPEGFDSVTVFFSDVVKFTILASKCSPFQTVNLLNDLYSNFDTIIEQHGVYKVESIGDGYLCVSGLPTRNGYAHIKQIVDMSLKFMEYCRSFKIPHLPRENVELRIGVNSGPCVAGVVGLSMPRYCLFGDTVNTASRMESNGKPSLIHLTSDAHLLLLTHYPNHYDTSSRGEVIIKGKGVMETFWVHGRIDDIAEPTELRSICKPSTVANERWITPPAPKPEIRSVSSHGSRPPSVYDPLQDHRKFKMDTLKVAN
uniref:Receptor-type guanylate cyclase gcy-2 n=1 Tax=Caenorhabditis elegans TaxID=6239 RepID=GCY2_CAEEL|nr:RecName: Full=Receptor-type guanylate cyclase gcy-2; Flags: Precursor [Caenorhabditis elegans]|eukprot:NP_496038.1 Receptor-type guanylate cyclase gcy-2 [Caenorhabditis elegans]